MKRPARCGPWETKLKTIVALLATLLCGPALADEPWVFEFEFDYGIKLDRLLDPDLCTKAVMTQFVPVYVESGDTRWTTSCGNRQPMYQHFLGRRIGRPLPKLEIELGWRHFSSPMDAHEISFDALAVRGRFRF